MRLFKLKKLSIFIIFLLGMNAYSQSNLRTGLYMFSPSIYNPGVVGTNSSMSITAISKTQWVGVKGAPNWSRIVMQSPLGKDMGYGGSISYFSVGARNFTDLNFDYAYKIKISNKGKGLKLSVGPKINMNYYNFNASDLRNINDLDNFVDLGSVFAANFGVGGFLYSSNYYISLSYVNAFDVPLTKSNSYVSSISPTMYVGGGYIYYIKKGKVKLRPDFLLSYNALDGSLNYDVLLSSMLVYKLWLGVSYKGGNLESEGNLGFFTHINLTSSVKIGYSYGYGYGAISNYSIAGTHEFLLSYIIPLRKSGIRGIL